MSNPHPTLALSLALAGVLEDVLKDEGISRLEAANRAGIPQSTLYRKLSGKTPFDVVELASVARIAGRTPSDLLAVAERRATA